MTTTGWLFFIEAADASVGRVAGVDLVRVHHQCDEELMGARHPAEVLAGLRGAAL
ncbi:hypothetical protein [Mycobacterium sp.]|uniref:hypothetical protein n=1 Tax=Mycobacterium sp. TaxID=1785 RepID=UPI003C759146